MGEYLELISHTKAVILEENDEARGHFETLWRHSFAF